jgi:hypothetical protein
MKRFSLFFLAAALLAEVSGVVTNKTTGKPQQSATVTLYKLGGAGMETVESVKSGADGRFTIAQTPDGPHLIQTAFDGVTYNHMLPPGSPPTGIDLKVFSSTKKQPAQAKVATHMILLEPSDAELTVNESLIYKNDGTLSYNDPDGGTLRFTVPATAGKVKVMASGPQGMPVERAAEPAGQSGAFKVDFPIKPGETRFDLTYTISTPTEFSKKLTTDAAARVVVPAGVTLISDDLQLLGQEPQTQASIYETKKREFAAQIQGTGSLQAPQGEGGEEEGEGLKQIRPRVYDRFYVILGLSLVILVLSFLLLYRRPSPAPAVPAAKDKHKA